MANEAEAPKATGTQPPRVLGPWEGTQAGWKICEIGSTFGGNVFNNGRNWKWSEGEYTKPMSLADAIAKIRKDHDLEAAK